MKLQLLTILALSTVTLASAAELNARKAKVWCTAERRVNEDYRSYSSGWKTSEAEAIEEALAKCEADVIVGGGNCEIDRCTTRAVR